MDDFFHGQLGEDNLVGDHDRPARADRCRRCGEVTGAGHWPRSPAGARWQNRSAGPTRQRATRHHPRSARNDHGPCRQATFHVAAPPLAGVAVLPGHRLGPGTRRGGLAGGLRCAGAGLWRGGRGARRNESWRKVTEAAFVLPDLERDVAFGECFAATARHRRHHSAQAQHPGQPPLSLHSKSLLASCRRASSGRAGCTMTSRFQQVVVRGNPTPRGGRGKEIAAARKRSGWANCGVPAGRAGGAPAEGMIGPWRRGRSHPRVLQMGGNCQRRGRPSRSEIESR